jgi:integrase
MPLGLIVRSYRKTPPRESSRKIVDGVHVPRKHRVSEITPQSISGFQQKRLSERASRATTNRDVAALSAMLSRARRLRLISHNPCSDVGRLNERRERRQAKPLSYDEETRVKSVAPPWLRTLITLLVETGLRVKKEALPLRWSDVQLDSEPAWVHVRESKSAAGVRVVWLTRYCRDVLLSWRRLFGPELSPFVFPRPEKSSRSCTGLQRALE